MTRERAIERLMKELDFPEGMRPYVERKVDSLTDYSDNIDRYTVAVIKECIKNDLQ